MEMFRPNYTGRNKIVYSYKFIKVKDSNEEQKVKSNSQPNP